ncbi:MAG: electron transport complex subunit RsxE [Gammaproteobacteria bacterium]|nr:MAG: electron transport complex subunit RsxE [Gammaproteobacteria bacterium]
MQIRKLIVDGLWHNNPALVQLLGLCPLLAVSGTVVNGLGLGLATTLTLIISNLAVSLVRNQLPDEVRIPVFVMIIAAAVTSIELVISAWFYQLYLILGIFIPLIVTNCAIIARAEAFAFRNSPLPALVDGLFMGLGFTAVLTLLGAIREVIGYGTLLRQADLLFGDVAAGWTVTLVDGYSGFLLAILPPGAFIALGFMIALKNVIDQRGEARRQAAAVTVITPATTMGAV